MHMTFSAADRTVGNGRLGVGLLWRCRHLSVEEIRTKKRIKRVQVVHWRSSARSRLCALLALGRGKDEVFLISQ